MTDCLNFMFKQLPITYECHHTEQGGFKTFRNAKDEFVASRKVKLQFLGWQSGYFMAVEIFDETHNIETGKRWDKVFSQDVYDRDFDLDIHVMMASIHECRGRTAEMMAWQIFDKTCRETVFKTWLPSIYEFQEKMRQQEAEQNQKD